MIFTDDTVKRYEDFKDSDFVRTDDNLGIKYETAGIFEDTVILLRYNCPDKDCDAACLGWPDLHRHVKSKHGKVMWYVLMRLRSIYTETNRKTPVTSAYAIRRCLHMSTTCFRSASYGSMKE